MIILGINAYHGDAAAAIIRDGKLVAAAEEERFNRIKHSAGFPGKAIRCCLKEARVSIKDLDYIAVPRNPKVRIFRKIYYGIKIPKLALRRLLALRKTQGIKNRLAEILGIDPSQIKAKIINVEHHRSHLASSFFVSPFEKSLLFSADGMGDFASTMWGIGKGNKIQILGEVTFPHSLGLYYTAITQYLGFPNYGDEYKVMGLAAYGEPEYREEFKKIIFNTVDLGFKLGLDYFIYHKKLVDMHFEDGYPALQPLYSGYLEKRLGPHRNESEPIETRHKNIAASLQERLEEVLFTLLNSFYEKYHSKGDNRLSLSGGVAFNCVANGKIFQETHFKEVYIPPACGDAGLAVGAAYYIWNQLLNKPREFMMQHAYWGPQFNYAELNYELAARSQELERQGCKIIKIEDKKELCQRTAGCIADGKVVGWFQGRMEWGPRALGNRSIVVDPRRPEIKDLLNLRIKHREPFRPFAPSMLEEKLGEYCQQSYPSPFMLFAYKIKPEKLKLIPAVIHIDGTARIQSVNYQTNPLYWQLIKEFEKITGIPVVLNTSFNENEPIVCSPKEALGCFLRTKMDMLVLENFIINK
ncbi:MAG: carbamoyltransferase [Omnitrophica WOR_2 bacterium RBG_13_41_10]|nr:MAG: carbamoyltransferase [Omnitrophica WOR_2 bacterium RBG_13_41_10]